jgi:hypothetical protein
MSVLFVPCRPGAALRDLCKSSRFQGLVPTRSFVAGVAERGARMGRSDDRAEWAHMREEQLRSLPRAAGAPPGLGFRCASGEIRGRLAILSIMVL